ncbi:MAG: hypothetical protein A3F14_02590 [Gammaproteobacteria bacterium RIFCSPHIGHO2_12_FULL_43_28]|nr:MAG: hypothetical protein A3F14_02590 [Gammaproteobacteria bacterium RIFCSPHIGHO2_12_FULL_43_28]
MRRLVVGLGNIGIFLLSAQAQASGFQLFEQDVTSVANYHAGYAALADNASIAFYNPAGMTEIKNQQAVLSVLAVAPSVKYRGTVRVNTIGGGLTPVQVTAQGGQLATIPEFHYVAPLGNNMYAGLSVGVPFGLKTNYGKTTFLRYAATVSSVNVVDITPALGFDVSENASLGFGLDIQRMHAEFDQVATQGGPDLDSDGLDRGDDTAYGFNVGGLYRFSPNTRLGASFHSQVVHHLSGTSVVSGPLADILAKEGIPIPDSKRATTQITLPPYTAVSLYHRINPAFAVMGSVIYTQWSTINEFVLKNVAGLEGGSLEPSNNITVKIPAHFRNTVNVSVGGDYNATDKMILRGAVGYDQTPVRNAYRNVQLPDNNRYVIAAGGHYQLVKTVGVDLGWMHLFSNKAHVIPPTQVTGAERVNVNGSVRGSADVYGLQVVWDMA